MLHWSDHQEEFLRRVPILPILSILAELPILSVSAELSLTTLSLCLPILLHFPYAFTYLIDLFALL